MCNPFPPAWMDPTLAAQEVCLAEMMRFRLFPKARLVRGLLLDGWFWFAILLALLIALLYVPIVARNTLVQEIVSWYLDPTIMLLIVAYAFNARRRFEEKEERLFWLCLLSAYGSWCLLRLLYLIPHAAIDPFYDFGCELFYMFFYTAFLVALEIHPHTPGPHHFSRAYRLVGGSAPILFSSGLFFYFAFIPATFNRASYETFIPSFVVYVALDYYLGFRLLSLVAAATSPAWRRIYGFLCFSSFSWAVLDLIDGFYSSGFLALPYLSPSYVLWCLPFFLFVLATRVAPDEEKKERVTDSFAPQPVRGFNLIAYGFALPVIHYGGYAAGLFEGPPRFHRGLFLVGWLALFAVLTLFQHTMLNRHTRELEEIRARNLRLLEAIGQIQSKYIETSDSHAIFVAQMNLAMRLSGSRFGFVAEARTGASEDWFMLRAHSGDEAVADRQLGWDELSPYLAVTLETGTPAFEHPPPDHALVTIIPTAPSLFSLLLLPLHHGERLVGLLGLANREGAVYDNALLTYLSPFLGTCAGIMSAYRDEQERLRIEEKALRISKILDDSLEEIYIFDAQTLLFLQVNRGARENIGLRLERLVALSPIDLMPAMDEARFRKLLEPLCDSRLEKIQYTAHHRREDGSTYPIDAFVQCSRLESVAVFVAIVVDISERRRMEAEKEELTAQIVKAQEMETVGTLTGGIAHDFNNMLTPIIWCSDMALADPREEEARGQIEHILLAARRCRDLVNQMLTFSRRSIRHLEPILLQDIITDSLRMLQASRPPHVRIQKNINPQCGAVLADGAQLHQVVINLCNNAFQAMSAGDGSLTIDLEPFDVDLDFCRGFPNLNEGRFLRLRVTDTGCGMDEQTLAHLYEPFFTTKPVGEGTGLGLSVIHGIIMSMGGTITVESQPDVGSSFCVYLPPYEDKPLAVANVKQRTQGHILLVDDMPDVVEATRCLLERSGYDVAIETDSARALNRFRARPEHYDLVISDLVMPRLTGLQLAARLLSIRPDLPIILVTGAGKMIEPEHLLRFGIRVCLAKPLEPDVLLDAIVQALTFGLQSKSPVSFSKSENTPRRDGT